MTANGTPATLLFFLGGAAASAASPVAPIGFASVVRDRIGADPSKSTIRDRTPEDEE